MSEQESQADTGHGGIFERKSNTDTWDEVAEVINITPPQKSREAVESTHLQSPDKYNEYLKGMKDGGEPTITMAYLGDATHISLDDDLEDEEIHDYRITYPDGSQFEFRGFPSAINPSEIAVNERLTVEVTFRTTGKPTWTEVA